VSPLDPGLSEGVRLTEDERSHLTYFLTQYKLSGKTLHDRMAQIMLRPSYENMTDDAKALELQKIFDGYLRNAEAKMRQEHPDLNQAVLDRQIARKMKLIGSGVKDQG
jgi:hypothetical protein